MGEKTSLLECWESKLETATEKADKWESDLWDAVKEHHMKLFRYRTRVELLEAGITNLKQVLKAKDDAGARKDDFNRRVEYQQAVIVLGLR